MDDATGAETPGPPTGRPRAWLLLATGEHRQRASNDGYADRPASWYRWDSTVANHAALAPGDLVVLWDKQTLIGASAVSGIVTGRARKNTFRCPVCGRADIKARPTRTPGHRCQSCRALFEEPAVLPVETTTYRADYEPGWTDLDGLLDAATLRGCAVSVRSQLSLRPLDWTRFTSALGQVTPTTVLGATLAASAAASQNATAVTSARPGVIPTTGLPGDLPEVAADTGRRWCGHGSVRAGSAAACSSGSGPSAR